MVIYMFYKNVMYVMAQFWFGFANAFSGQTLYEAFIYQGWNIVFTSVPILWWSTCDLQYDKEKLVTVPSLYQIGLKNQCFSTKVFF
jgi:phospholipid-transporting ATPase